MGKILTILGGAGMFVAASSFGLLFIYELFTDFSTRQFGWMIADFMIPPMGIARGLWHILS